MNEGHSDVCRSVSSSGSNGGGDKPKKQLGPEDHRGPLKGQRSTDQQQTKHWMQLCVGRIPQWMWLFLGHWVLSAGRRVGGGGASVGGRGLNVMCNENELAPNSLFLGR